MEQMGIPLLTTKLHIPPRRPPERLVPRPRLVAQLEEALRLRHRLTIVSARAGSGKTTLVSEWLHEQGRPSAWLSLDANDNDPRRLFGYLVAALDQLGVEISQTVLNQLSGSQLLEPEALIAALINDVAASAVPVFLVLDDYHMLHDERIHQAMAFLIEHQPTDMHLILVTRVDPPLPLARLRGRGQVTEIRDQDLRFTAEEAAWFINKVMALEMPADAVATLEQRTEGWIVGLQMAAISMQSRKPDGDRLAFVEAFGGSNRFVLDYLMEEVFGQQPPAVQCFLIESAVLERMCGALCDAVHFGAETPGQMTGAGAPGASATEARIGVRAARDSQAILAHLERSNLFVLPLDDERRWYRYHHLFAELLRSTLRQQRSAAQIRTLHRRASRWYQGEELLEEAMIHAMAAQDYERAAAMIDENIVSMLSRSEAPVLLGWIERMPEEVVLGRPWVDIYRAYTLALSGQPDEADAMLEGAEARIDPAMPRASELVGHIAAIRSYTANLRGKADLAIEMAMFADRKLPAEHLVARGMATYALTVTHFAQDDMDGAIRAARRMLEIGQRLERLLMIVTALCDLGAASKVQGRLYQAQAYYDRARRWLAQRGGLDSRVRSAYESGMADLMYQLNQVDAAREHALTAIAYCRRFGVPSELVSSQITLMRVFRAQGDSARALRALREAEGVTQTHHIRFAIQIALCASRVVQWLAVDDVVTASRWAQACGGGSELEQIALARLRLAQGRATGAHQLLEQQRARAEAGQRTGRLIEILGLQALALDAQGASREAEAALSRALALAQPEGSLRVFLDIGWPLRALLERMAAKGEAPRHGTAPYVHVLLDAFQQEREAQRSRGTDITAPRALLAEPRIDPLTDREQEVLRLLGEGLSNKGIAGRLIVAPSTIKQHLKNIYAKLDVHSRTQAVARGRELGLL